MSDREEFEEWAANEKRIRNFTLHDDGEYLSERLADMWQAWQAARAQGGQEVAMACAYCGGAEKVPAQQGSVPDEWLELLARRAEESDITYEATYDPGYDKPIEHDCDIEERVADWIRAQKGKTPQPEGQQGSVPEGWGYVVEVFLENVEEVTELLLSGGAADNIVALCNDLNKAATVAEKVLSTPQPEGDGWVKCSERLPTEADADFEYRLWCWLPERNDMKLLLLDQVIQAHLSGLAVLWKPTGLKRPQPPKEGQGDE